MKISELKETIRAKVRESLTVKTGGRVLTPQQQSQQIDQLKRTTGDQTAGSINNPVNFVKENNKFTAADIDKMSRSQLIDFLGLGEKEARNWSDKQLFGAARNLADEQEEPIDEADYLDDDDKVREGVDDDNTDFNQYDNVYEDMEDNSPDVDKYKLGEVETNSGFEANVGSGHRGLSVKFHPTDSRLLMISQDNGQRVIVEVEDVPELIEMLRGLA
jgi:hypothetical protein